MPSLLSRTLLSALFFVFLESSSLFAHFGVVKPEIDIVSTRDQSQINLMVAFMHPFEQTYMYMERPKRFGVAVKGALIDLTTRLRPVSSVNGMRYWSLDYKIPGPGLYWFFVEPQPYWEKAENAFIQHLTKVAVSAYGIESGWEKPIGLLVEIVPSVRPFALWTGNTFCGQVLYKGKPRPGCSVEVEYFNDNKRVHAPDASYITQTLVTDENGRFCYSMPRAGWWGFAALLESEKGLEQNGIKADLELGGVIWIHARDMK